MYIFYFYLFISVLICGVLKIIGVGGLESLIYGCFVFCDVLIDFNKGLLIKYRWLRLVMILIMFKL